MTTRTRTAFALTLAGFLLLALAAGAQTEVERRVPAAPGGTVVIENVSGSVVVTGWDNREVEVTGTLGRDVEELTVESEGNTVEITVEVGRGSGRRQSSAQLEVRVPRGSHVEVETVSADVTVSGVDGELALETVSGAIRVDGAPREVAAESVSGNVEIEADGAVSVETVSGNIDIRGARGTLEAESVSGNVTVAAEDLERAEIASVSGRIDLEISLAGRATLEIESHSGGVELALPASTSARFEVETWSGRIDNQLGPPARKVGRYTPGYELKFSVGGGDARITIESFSGDVVLRAR